MAKTNRPCRMILSTSLRQFAGFHKAAPRTRPGPGSCTKATDANVVGSVPGLELQLKVLAEVIVLVQLADLLDLLHDVDVSEVLAGILAARDLRFGMCESDGHVDIGVVLLGARLDIDVSFEIGRGLAVWSSRSQDGAKFWAR